MRRYKVTCPKCGEETILLPAEAPEKPYCNSCEEDIDLEVIRVLVKGWGAYLEDVDEMLEKEKLALPAS